MLISWLITLVMSVTPGLQIHMGEPCPAHNMDQAGYQINGCMLDDKINLYVSDATNYAVMTHELAHVWDDTMLTNYDRARWRRAANVHRRWTWPEQFNMDHPPAQEYFAESVAQCARWPRAIPSWAGTAYQWRPIASVHRRVCSVIKAIMAEDYGYYIERAENG